MERLYSVLKKISHTLAKISQWLIAALILIIVYDVAMRYFFNKPSSWVYEMSYILGAFIASLAFAFLYIEEGNVRVDVFYCKFSPKVKLITDILFNGLIFIPSFYMLIKAWFKNLSRAFITKEVSTITTWYPPLWPIKTVITFGLGLFIIVLVVDTLLKIIRLTSTLGQKRGVEQHDIVS